MRLLPLLLLLAACSRQDYDLDVAVGIGSFFLGIGFIVSSLIARLRRENDVDKYFDTYVIGVGVMMMFIGYVMKT